MQDDKIKRINELAKKAKAEGLSNDELKERERLRKEYIQNFRHNLKSQLDNIKIED